MEEIVISMLPILFVMMFIIYLVIDWYKSEYESEVIKYYTIDHDESGMYTITLWVAEVCIWKNKCRKNPVEVECRKSPHKSDIDEKEAQYNRMDIYPMYRTYGAEKCLL